MPAKEFLSRFFAREGYKDGVHGLMLSLFMAFYHFIIFANVWEKQGFKENEEAELLIKTEKELGQVNKDLKFWFVNEKLKKISNPLRKNLYKLLQKFA